MTNWIFYVCAAIGVYLQQVFGGKTIPSRLASTTASEVPPNG